jgi:serine/threonine protein kinase
MHSKGMMHRDIKPENLILKDNQNDWDIKIADFGLATAINCGELIFKRCGTPGYVAPEILADEKYDEKVDIFSAGVILYILLTGGSPFHADSYNQILWKNKTCEINFNFSEFGQKFSDPAVDLMKKMLAKNPKERISASEALKHQWILTRGVLQSPSISPIYLNYAQENMKKFQEDQRVNAKNMKPKEHDQSALERPEHAPSQLINGRMVTVADSKNQFFMNSPDVRKSSNATGNLNLAEVGSKQGTISLKPTNDGSEQVSFSEEMSFVKAHLNGYNHEKTLLSHFADLDKNNSSVQQVPVFKNKSSNQKPNMKKAMNVQETLLKYISSQTQPQQKTPVNKEQQQQKEQSPTEKAQQEGGWRKNLMKGWNKGV